MSRPRLVALSLACLTLLVFVPVGRFGFVNYDDTDYITENSFAKGGLTLAGIHWAFTSFHASNWHPLTWISHMIDCSLFGPNAGGHHFVNVLFHAANTALIFLLLWRWTARLWPGVLIAALFAWHPLHVESVAWISERKDVLSTFLGLLALLAYTRFVKERSRCHFWLALLWFGLGLLAKPMLVTLPFVLLLLDFWPWRRFVTLRAMRPLFIEKTPFFALSLASCVVTFLAQKHGEAVVSLAKIPLLYRLENAPVAVVVYLRKFFLPYDLCVIYPMPEHIPILHVIAAVLILAAISAVAWHWRLGKPYFLMGWLWFIGTLVPVLGLVQVGGQALADRYTYIPSIGLFIALVFLTADLAGKIQMPARICFGFAAVILLACILVTRFQLGFWYDSETLFRRAIAVTRDNDIALINLGVTLDVQGRWEESLAVYRQAEALDAGRVQVHNNLGNVLDKLGRHAESLEEYQKALRLHPGDAPLQNDVGTELAALGRFEEALVAFHQATRINPNYVPAYMEAAKVLFKLGHDPEALAEFNTALQLDPANYQTLATIARYLAANENPAVRDEKTALALALKANDLSNHSQPLVFDILGMTLAANGDFTNAILCAQNALAIASAVQMSDTNMMRARLELYQNHQPWRESFRATNAPGRL